MSSRGRESDQPRILKCCPRAREGHGPEREAYTVCGRHPGWVQERDILNLIKLVDSKEPCSRTVLAISSHIPRGTSFVGQEVVFLLDGYQKGSFPPSLHSEYASAVSHRRFVKAPTNRLDPEG